MRENIIEMLLHVGILLIYGISAVIATAVGVAIEYFSYINLVTGDYQMAGYFGVLGLVVLGFAYLIVTNELWPALRPA